MARTGGRRVLRAAGAALLAVLIGFGTIIAVTGPPSSTMFNAPDPLDRMRAISANKRGWGLLAVYFGLASMAVTGVFGVITWTMRGPARVLAAGATLMSAVSTLLWLPLMRGRLQVGKQVDDMIRVYRPGAEPDLSGGSQWTFWPYTHTGLASIGLMGLALSWSGLRRKTGMVVGGLALLSEAVLIPWWRDWLPVFTYALAGVVGAGLVAQRETRGPTRWAR